MNSLKKTKFKVITYTIKELFEKMKYIEIPLYQRRYKWDEEQVIPLIEDIIERKEDGNEHYFGVIAKSIENVTLEKEDVVKNRIIDGQQRITTSIILIHFLSSKIYEYDKNVGVMGGFTKEFNNVKFVYEIKTNESNAISQITSQKPEFVSMSGRIKDVYEIIDNYFIKLKLNKGIEFKYYTDLLEVLISNFKIACLEYEINKLEEMLVFENLNSKGSPLEEFDLIRNFIISFEISDKESNNPKYYLQKFNCEIMQLIKTGISRRIPSETTNTFEKFLETYLTWKMEELKSYKSYKLYKNFKKFIKENNIGFEKLIKELKKFCSLYLSVDSKEKNRIGSGLWFRVFSKKAVHYPFIFALFDKYSNSENEWKSNDKINNYMKVLSSHLIKLMSVNGTGQSFGGLIKELKTMIYDNKTPEQIKTYLATGDEVKNGNTPQSSDFITSCQKLQTQKWISEAIIDIIENSINNANESIDYNGRTLEHIMPQKPKEPGWNVNDKDFSEKHKIFLNQIGNLVFLNGPKNSSAGNKSFHDKNMEYYKDSISPLINSQNIKGLEKVTEQLEWTFEIIKKRTKILAKKAAEILE